MTLNFKGFPKLEVLCTVKEKLDVEKLLDDQLKAKELEREERLEFGRRDGEIRGDWHRGFPRGLGLRLYL